jgi:hypothetical protein
VYDSATSVLSLSFVYDSATSVLSLSFVYNSATSVFKSLVCVRFCN